MRIGFDVSQTGSGKAGCGFFAHAMIEALIDRAPEHEYALFPSFGDFYFDASMPLANPYPGSSVRYGPRHLSRQGAERFWNGPGAEALLDDFDIVQANNFWCPARPLRGRLLYTLYDLAFLVEPAWTTEANRQGCFAGVFRAAIAADWIVAISEASRTHFLGVFPAFPADRIRVVPPCSRFDRVVEGRRPTAVGPVAPRGFWLSVGTIEPRKNQRRLVEAYAAYRRSTPTPIPLVLAGGKGWLMDDFDACVADLGVADHVVMTGYVRDEELVWLYENCRANLYPSLFEGFGLPVLEGMQFGAPTIAADNSSIPEVTGDAAILLDATDVDAWTNALLDLDRRPERLGVMAEASRRQAGRFAWKASAAALLRLYEEAVATPKRWKIE